MSDASTRTRIGHAALSHPNDQQAGLLVVSHKAPLLEQLCLRVRSVAQFSTTPEGSQ